MQFLEIIGGLASVVGLILSLIDFDKRKLIRECADSAKQILVSMSNK